MLLGNVKIKFENLFSIYFLKYLRRRQWLLSTIFFYLFSVKFHGLFYERTFSFQLLDSEWFNHMRRADSTEKPHILVPSKKSVIGTKGNKNGEN